MLAVAGRRAILSTSNRLPSCLQVCLRCRNVLLWHCRLELGFRRSTSWGITVGAGLLLTTRGL